MTVGSNSGFKSSVLVSFIERVERLEEEKAALASDIREVYAEAKGSGFDAAIMRMCIRLRKMSKDQRDEMEALRDLYMAAISGKEARDTAKSFEQGAEEADEGDE
jgi:uncharacterized protein (UPF0335 family)